MFLFFLVISQLKHFGKKRSDEYIFSTEYESNDDDNDVYKSYKLVYEKNLNFSVYEIKDGDKSKPIVMLVHGFLSESQEQFETELKQLEKTIYHDRIVWVVKWESWSWSWLIGRIIGAGVTGAVIGSLFKKKDSKDSYAVEGAVGVASLGLLTVWNEAVSNCEDMSNSLTDFLKQSEDDFVLIGHSLGARGILLALSKLREKSITNIENVYLLAAAANNDNDLFDGIDNIPSNQIKNCHLYEKDGALGFFYKIGMLNLGDQIGMRGLEIDGVINIDMDKYIECEGIDAHNDYFNKLSKILPKKLKVITNLK